MTMHAINCDVFDDRLSDYLEGELLPGDRRALEAHLASCLRCTTLVRDLEAIRSGASTLAELTPSRDLWDGIAKRIEAPVVPLVSPRAVVAPPPRHRSFDRVRLAAVAAALVAVTAGVTYTLTVLGTRTPSATQSIAEVPRADSNPRSDTGETSRGVAPTVQLAGRDTASAHSNAQPEPAAPVAQPVRNGTEAATHSREIDRLRTVFLRNRHQLDPRTAAIIEANLKVIDEAIAQSKAALEQDPASGFLNEQLNNALDKKLELLRTAALLPQRT